MIINIPTSILEEIKDIPDLKRKIEKNLKSSITELLEIILGGAVALKASDLHFEPQKDQTKIRLRVDGFLQDIIFLNNDVYQNILSRVKILSKIKLNITGRPQPGRFTIFFKDKERENIEVRASTLPTENGESIVLRILDPKMLIEIEHLGLRKGLLDLFGKEIQRPNGMIIITGPTGSGKTTTLYAFLKKIQKPGIKIITIEDPPEYQLKGITQTQVNQSKKYTFASGLQSIMRQDPDVILVGEIRNSETAKIAIQAALTGHLVLTTLHTNDAPGTIARLVSLGAKPVNIGPAINIAIAQRLVRKLCPKCRQVKEATPEEIKKIKDGLKNIPKEIDIPKIKEGLKLSKAKGCKYCNFTGYRERVGIFESFLVDEEIEKFILNNPSISSLREKVIKKGMVKMKQDGLIKVLQQDTTLEEIERVTGK